MPIVLTDIWPGDYSIAIMDLELKGTNWKIQLSLPTRHRLTGMLYWLKKFYRKFRVKQISYEAMNQAEQRSKNPSLIEYTQIANFSGIA
jgi:hypothetical protein